MAKLIDYYESAKARYAVIEYYDTPPSLNKLIGSRNKGLKKSRIVKEWTETFKILAYKHKIIQFVKPKISFIFNFPDKRRRDIDNYLKVPLDALVKSGLIKDDCSKMIGLPVAEMHYEKFRSTLIFLEETF